MTTMLSLILAFMLSIGGSPAASVNPAGCPGDTGIQAPIDNNRTINHFSEDYNQKTASRAKSKKTGKTPSINELETNSSIRFSRFSIEKLRQARYFNHRYYRFNSVDPVINRVAALSNPQLWNLYAYCRNNPITYFDPYGRDILEDLKRKATQGLNHIVPNVLWMDSSNAEKMKRDKATLEKALALTAGVALAFSLIDDNKDGKEGDDKSIGGKKASDSSKGMPHGDSGRALGKGEKQIKDLENKLKTAKGTEKKRIKQKIENIIKSSKKAKKGETHHRK